MLAHHYPSALELARAAGADTAELEVTGQACVSARRAARPAQGRPGLVSGSGARRFLRPRQKVERRGPKNEPQSMQSFSFVMGVSLNSVALGSEPRGPHASGRRAALAAGDSGQAGRGTNADLRDVLASRPAGTSAFRASEGLRKRSSKMSPAPTRRRTSSPMSLGSGCSPAKASMRSVSGERPLQWPMSSASMSSEQRPLHQHRDQPPLDRRRRRFRRSRAEHRDRRPASDSGAKCPCLRESCPSVLDRFR